jgi:hypothetical protein
MTARPTPPTSLLKRLKAVLHGTTRNTPSDQPETKGSRRTRLLRPLGRGGVDANGGSMPAVRQGTGDPNFGVPRRLRHDADAILRTGLLRRCHRRDHMDRRFWYGAQEGAPSDLPEPAPG